MRGRSWCRIRYKSVAGLATMITCQSRQLPTSSWHGFSKWKSIVSVSLQFMKLGLLGSDTELLFPHIQMAWARIRWLLQKVFQGKKLVLCWPPSCQNLPGPVSHIPPKQYVCCKKLPVPARDCPGQNIPDTLLAAAAKEGILKGKSEGRKKEPLVTSSGASEDYSGNVLLLSVIVLEFLCQGSFWSTARAR